MSLPTAKPTGPELAWCCTRASPCKEPREEGYRSRHRCALLRDCAVEQGSVITEEFFDAESAQERQDWIHPFV
jgi:hypothetical protein